MMVRDAVAYERQENTDQVHIEETGTGKASGTRDRCQPEWNWRSSFLLLALSYLLIAILFGIVMSSGSRLSSEVKKVHEQLPMKEGLFPCGSQSREWEYFHGRCYFFSTQKVGWHTAKDHCEEKNSTLVVVHNVAEQNFLQLQTKGERYWIGLNDLKAEGEWRWVDGTNYRTSFKQAAKNWKMGQPTDYERNEDCAEISVSGEWNDENCIRENFYVCERPLPS